MEKKVLIQRITEFTAVLRKKYENRIFLSLDPYCHQYGGIDLITPEEFRVLRQKYLPDAEMSPDYTLHISVQLVGPIVLHRKSDIVRLESMSLVDLKTDEIFYQCDLKKKKCEYT